MGMDESMNKVKYAILEMSCASLEDGRIIGTPAHRINGAAVVRQPAPASFNG